ncbi:MAG: polysaccharide deacetylase family protein [Patescibacteria group bacterium]|nr:polysaccharide deacetylase family protein [Patescibacteria group bacterium]
MHFQFFFISFELIRIFITYDDGPSRYSVQIANMLRENGAKAIFFPIFCNDLNKVDNNKWLQEFEVGNHSNCHYEFSRNAEEEKIKSEIYKAHSTISRIQKNVSFFRFPSGKINSKSFVHLKNLGYQYILFWDVATNKKTTVKYVENFIFSLSKKKNNITILLHDIYPNSISITKNILWKFHFKLYYRDNSFYLFVVGHPDFLKKGGCDNVSCFSIDNVIIEPTRGNRKENSIYKEQRKK